MNSEIEMHLWSIAGKYLKYLRFIPFLNMVSVCNSLSFGTVNKNSDIDLFIVTEKNRLFITRTLLLILFHILGVRRHGNKIKNRICLSFFVDESNSNLQKIALKDDYYLVLWILKMYPVINKNDYYNKFLTVNSWLNTYINFRQDVFFNEKNRLNFEYNSVFKNFLQFIFSGFLGNKLEMILQYWQLKRAKSKTKPGDSGVIVENGILKFHKIDRRIFFNEIIRKNMLSNEKISKEKLNLALLKF